jgi:hypothetical protein
MYRFNSTITATLARDYGWVFRLDVTGQAKGQETLPAPGSC